MRAASEVGVKSVAGGTSPDVTIAVSGQVERGASVRAYVPDRYGPRWGWNKRSLRRMFYRYIGVRRGL